MVYKEAFTESTSFKKDLTIINDATMKLFVTDFDGTLARTDRTVASIDRETLAQLGRRGIVRVIATGRSLFSFRRTNRDPLPIDYLIFSTGAGVLRCMDDRIIRKAKLTNEETATAAQILLEADLDFSIQGPIPDCHEFLYHWRGEGNPDFAKRLALYKGHCRPFETLPDPINPSTQLIAILRPGSDNGIIDELQEKLPALTVIRTTSPLDGATTWVEIYPGHVSKGKTLAWLADELNLTAREVVAVGNDYNDLDLLKWAGTAYVVENGPEDLKALFQVVASNDCCGVTEAVGRNLED